MDITITPSNLTDGSKVFNLKLADGDTSIELNCVDEAAAFRLEEALRANTVNFA